MGFVPWSKDEFKTKRRTCSRRAEDGTGSKWCSKAVKRESRGANMRANSFYSTGLKLVLCTVVVIVAVRYVANPNVRY